MERKKRKKGWLKWGLVAFALLFLITMVYHQVKPLPDGVSRASEPVAISDDQIDFLADLTYQGEDTEVNEQEIFSRRRAVNPRGAGIYRHGLFLIQPIFE